MLRTHSLQLPAVEELSDDRPEEPAPRLALAGGSDRRPPDDESRGPARIIPFPRERVRTTPDERPDAPPPSGERGDGPRPPRPPECAASAASPEEEGEEPLWPAWMAHVLTRYRAPGDGGRGPSGVFI